MIVLWNSKREREVSTKDMQELNYSLKKINGKLQQSPLKFYEMIIYFSYFEKLILCLLTFVKKLYFILYFSKSEVHIKDKNLSKKGRVSFFKIGGRQYHFVKL